MRGVRLSIEFFLRMTKLSSAKQKMWEFPGSVKERRSLKRMFHKVGPRTEPCGHPLANDLVIEVEFSVKEVDLFVRYKWTIDRIYSGGFSD